MTPRCDGLAAALAALTERDAGWWGTRLADPFARLLLRHDRVVLTCMGAVSVLRWTVAGAQEAWERLCDGVVCPLGWAQDEGRRFADPLVGEPTLDSRAAGPGEDWSIRATGRVASGETLAFDVRVSRDVLWGLRGRAELDRTAREAGSQATWGLERVARERTLSHPPTVAACVALAADVQGVLAAEALARAFTGCARVAWRVGAASRFAWSPLDAEGRRVFADVVALGYAVHAADEHRVQLVCPALGDDDGARAAGGRDGG